MARPSTRTRLNPPVDSVSAASGVPVDIGVMDGMREGVTCTGVIVCVGKAVDVAGRLMRRSSFCSGRMTEVSFNPFHAIRAVSET